MSEELERLRIELDVLKRYAGDNIDIREAAKAVKLEIARLEAEVDPWREHRASVEFMRKTVYAAADVPKVVAYVDHLTADRERLAARVAELEAAAEPPFGPSDDQMEREIMSSAVDLMNGLNGKFDPDNPFFDRHRTVATVAKMLVEDKTIPDGERLAGVLMQMMGAGGAKPYEVCDE